jgi:predicted transglutaminase-like cysteine proteinase
MPLSAIGSVDPMEVLGNLSHMPMGPFIAPPPQWFDFAERYPGQADIEEKELPKNLRDCYQDLHFVNRSVNSLGYKADITDNWNAYDMRAMEPATLASFDCDDITLTKRRALHEVSGFDLGSMRPAYCQVPSARYGASWEDHMVLLVFAKEGTIVLDNMIPWIHKWDDSPYRWVACTATKFLWRLCGRKWNQRGEADVGSTTEQKIASASSEGRTSPEDEGPF